MKTKFIALAEVQNPSDFTSLTAIFDEDGITESTSHTSLFDKVVYLGRDAYDGDLFACYLSDTITLMAGKAGEEFIQDENIIRQKMH